MRAWVRSVATVVATVVAVGLMSGLLVVAPVMVDGPRSAARAGVGMSGDRVGFATGGNLPWEDPLSLERDMQMMAASGGQWVGIDVGWQYTEVSQPVNGNHFYNWSATDRLVRSAHANGRNLTVMGTLDYTPSWAQPAGCASIFCGPTTQAGFDGYAAFAKAAAFRYGPSASDPTLRNTITTWQIWNEPNHQQFWKPNPNLAAYVQMLEQAYLSIKSVSPNATVMTGGTSPAGDAPDGSDIAPMTWLAGLYAKGARGFFDAVGYHGYEYGYSNHPADTYRWNAFKQAQNLHVIMVANGDGAKKIWGTEVGAPTGTDPNLATSPAGQAQDLTEYYTIWNTSFAAFTGPLFWHNHRDDGTNPASAEDNFGLVSRDFAPKPAYSTLQQLIAPLVVGAQYWSGWDIVRGVALTVDGKGGVDVDGWGGLHAFGLNANPPPAVPVAGAPYWAGWDIARGVALLPDGSGGYVLDGWGGLHPFGAAPPTAGNQYWSGWDIARGVALLPDGSGGYVLDGWGGLHPFAVGGNPMPPPAATSAYWAGWDIARGAAALVNGHGGYVVDGWGGLHPFTVNGSPAPSTPTGTPYWAGWDIARGVGLGIGAGVEVDGWGGLHLFSPGS